MADKFNIFDKTVYKTADVMARRKAEGMTEQFNEPSYILEGSTEFYVARGLAWDYRDSWGKDDWPTWAKEDPDSKLVETIYPKDHLTGNYAKVRKTVKKMRANTDKVRYEYNFDVGEICRDYPDVRQMLRLVESAAAHLSSVLISLDSEVEDAIRQHKEKNE